MKRILVLYVLAAALIVALAIPASAVYPEQWWNSNKGAVELFRVSAEGGGGGAVPTAPAYIEYTLNCKATVTVEILPSDSAGIPTGDPAVSAEVLADQLKGAHTYLWACVDTAGNMVPVGYYVAELTASSSPAQWDANLGLYINWQRPVPTKEYVYRNSTGDTWLAGTTYVLGQWVVPTTPNGHRYKCTVAGTSDALTEPTWPLVNLTTVVDGTVTWTEDSVVIPVDTVAAMENKIGGFYGIGVNNNPSSPYYGRIYVPHQTNRDVYMYDVDGTFLGAMNDDGITWNTSAPWDCVVADDGYVFVSDRTAMAFYIFKPDGSAWISRSNVLTTNDRAIGVRLVAGVHHCLITSGAEVYDVQATIAPDGLSATWANRVFLYMGASADGGGAGAFGMCANSDMTVIYQASRGGGTTGIRKWENIGGVWTMNVTWTGLNGIPCADVEIAADGNLWVTASRGYTAAAPSMYKLSATDGSIISSYDVITWGFMLARDAVGGVAMTFGKSTVTWPGNYWGMFAAPGTYGATETTGAFYVPEDPAPVLVPGSETWTYGSGAGLLTPDGSDTALVSFQVIDANGYSDIGDIDMDLKELKTTDDSTPVEQPDTKVENGTNPMIADCTKTVTAVRGTQAGAREIGVKPYDTHGSYTLGSMYVPVAANYLDAYVKHIRTGGEVLGATLYARGGKVGAYGYPFTYESPYTSDVLGNVLLDVSEGAYEVWAEKTGYKTQTPQTVNVPLVTIPAERVYEFPDGNVGLGALTVAEARDFTRDTIFASVEGLTYARPRGLAPTACTGLDNRLDTAVSTTVYSNRKMWYMCDADNASEGMQFQLRLPDTAFDRQWDDSALINEDTGNSLYLGKRPDEGDTICVQGWLETRPGYETRLILDDASLMVVNASKYKYTYYNLTGAGIEATKPLPTPLSTTVVGITHVDSASYAAMWGQYAEVNATPVSWHPDGKNLDGTSVADPNMYLVIVDSASNWSTVTFQTLSSLNIPPGTATTPPPVTLGVAYTFRGACGRRSRFGVGTIRPRGTGDITMTGEAPPDPGADSVGVIRGISSGSVAFRGIATAKFTGYMFVENSDRSVGVKVVANPTWVAVGDEVMVVGDVQLLDGQKQVLPSLPVAVVSSGNPLPELGMRHRDVGGVDYDAVTDPGVYHGRGPLNVGLLVTVSGLVTYRDDAALPTFFYIWDGSNMCLSGEDPRPLDDGTGYRGLRIDHSGWLSVANRAARAYQDWVTVNGVIVVKQVDVGAETISIPAVLPKTVTLNTSFLPIHMEASTALTARFNLFALSNVPAATGPGIVPYATWAASTGYGVGDVVIPTTPNNRRYACIVAGTSGATEPIWLTALGATVVDNTVTWKNIGWDYNGDPNGSLAWECPQVLAPTKDPSEVDGRVYRMESANRSQYLYDMWSEPNGSFGGILLGDGYWVLLDDAWEVNYTGLAQEFPQWIASSAPECWMQMAHPQDHSTETTDIQMSNGAVVKSFFDASQWGDNWVQSTGYWWDNQSQSQYDIALPDDWPSTTTMQPWHGYQFLVHEPNRAWIIP